MHRPRMQPIPALTPLRLTARAPLSQPTLYVLIPPSPQPAGPARPQLTVLPQRLAPAPVLPPRPVAQPTVAQSWPRMVPRFLKAALLLAAALQMTRPTMEIRCLILFLESAQPNWIFSARP